MNNNPNDVKQAFAERLHKAMDNKDYPKRGRARVLSQQFGVSDKGAGKWLNGDAIPETSKIPLLASFLDVATEWLLSGKENQTTKNIEAKDGWGNVRPSNRTLRVIPLLDFVQAGTFHETCYDGLNPKGESYTSYKGGSDKSVFSLIVNGESMSPEFKPGDEIVVDASLSPKPGALVIAQEIQHGTAMNTFKKYRLLGVNEHGVDIVELVPLNPDYPTYNSTQIEISIIGVIVEHHRNISY